MKSPIVLLSCLLDDVKRLEPDVRNLDRDLKTIEARFKHEGIGFLTIAFSTYCDALDEGLAARRFTCPAGFKSGRLALPRLFSGLLCEVFDIKTGLLKENPRMGYLKCLREILRLFRKLTLTDDRANELDRQAKLKFLSCDESIAQTKWNERYKHHLIGVCRLVLNQLEGVSYENLACKHGPGAVSERLTANRKWEAVASSLWNNPEELEGAGYDTVLVDLYSSVSDRPQYWGLSGNTRLQLSTSEGISKPGQRTSDPSPSGCVRDDWVERPYRQAPSEGETSKQSRLVTVAKNSTSRRTITVEPVLKQFLQQGLNVELRNGILKDRILSNCLDLTDQSHNQKLALDGSRTGLWATIDLSSASDLLSLQLVKTVFQHVPTFLDWLVRSRSEKYCDGTINHRVLLKYAGMGNATTFPVQSVTFALIAIAAILDALGMTPTPRRVERASKLVRVYGDDIIVPAQYSQQVVNWIEHFGLKVNKSKSFTDHISWFEHRPCFRESCGVDAFGGVNITPLYLRVLPESASLPKGTGVRPSTDPSAIASLVATSNLAWERCLYKFSAKLATEVESILRKKLPIVPARSSALGLHTRIDSCVPTKWDESMQRLVFKAPVLKPTYRSDCIDGYAALLKFYHTPLLGRGVRHLERTQIRFSSRIVWKWLPAEVLERAP